ncbi:MAG: hypothetical protein FWG05_02965 [Kiritimatiellaeota bacterium]|nr:hypothetical protein [Kiritimatiellota bacterium]
MSEWKQALRLLRAIAEGACPPARGRAFLAQCKDPHLSKLAPLLAPPVTDRKILCALVPVERRASRERISDADMGITTTDPVGVEKFQPPNERIVIADNIRSALNIGGIFRTCAFFGVSRLYLCGYTATPENPQVAKSAMGAESIVAWQSADSATDAIRAVHAEGFSVYALETARDAIDVAGWTPCHPSAVVIGNERFGLDPETVALCDGAIAIRGAGAKNSLNVVCALSIALFARTSSQSNV